MSSLNKELVFKLSDPDALKLNDSGVIDKVGKDAVIEVEAFILAAMDKYGYDISGDNKIINIHVPKGEFVINDDVMSLSDELIDSVDDIDMDPYRVTASELFNDVNVKFGL